MHRLLDAERKKLEPSPAITRLIPQTVTPSLKGDISVLKVSTALVLRGISVSFPWGNGQRYDLIADLAGRLITVQVKTGRMVRGAILFKSCGQKRDKTPTPYIGQVEFFAVFSPDLDQVYFVPVDECPPFESRIRIEPPRNGQEKGIRHQAQDCHIDAWVAKYFPVKVVPAAGFEPAASSVSSWRSNQTELNGPVQ